MQLSRCSSWSRLLACRALLILLPGVAASEFPISTIASVWESVPKKDLGALSYVLAIATAVEFADPSMGRPLVIHLVGASVPELEVGCRWSLLSEILGPSASHGVELVMVGPTLPRERHGEVLCGVGAESQPSDGQPPAVSVTLFSGVYGPEVQRVHGEPHMIVLYNGDYYTCSWRRSLLYLSSLRRPLAFFFLAATDWHHTAKVLPDKSSFSVESLKSCDQIHAGILGRLKPTSKIQYTPGEGDRKKAADAWFSSARIMAGHSLDLAPTLMAERMQAASLRANTLWLVVSWNGSGAPLHESLVLSTPRSDEEL